MLTQKPHHLQPRAEPGVLLWKVRNVCAGITLIIQYSTLCFFKALFSVAFLIRIYRVGDF